MVFQNNLLMGAGGQADEAYEIDESCRFNDDDSAYLHWTPSGAGDSRDAWSLAIWFKHCELGVNQVLYDCQLTSAPYGNDTIFLQSDDKIDVQIQTGGGSVIGRLITTQVFRDPSAWQQLVVVWDSANAAAGNRLRLWINGSEVTAFDTDTQPSSGQDSITGSTPSKFGFAATAAGATFMDCYLSQVVFIDGTSLTPSSFGETNSTTGQWIPIDVSGLTFGTNGFLLDFADSSDLGNDVSGDNNFTSSGLAANDQVTDTPTDNFCTLNFIDKATQVILANGNLQYGLSSNAYTAVRGTIGLTSGKWYWELETVAGMGANTLYAGIATNASALQVSNAPTDGTAYVFVSYSGNKAYTTNVSYGSAWNTNGRVIGVALDLDAGKIWWSIDDTWQASGDPAAGSNEAYSSITGEWFPYIVFNDSGPNVLFNFGQSAFSGTQPSGFNAISTANFDDPTIADPTAYFQTTLYTGDGASSLAVNQGGNSTFEPDFVWIKNRDSTDDHVLTDSVRGATKLISSNNTDVEATDADTLTAFDSDGFTVGDDVKVNTSGEDYVGWQWLADESWSSGATGTRIASSGTRNTTAGFSIASWTHTTSANYNIAHGLSTRPDFFATKARTQGTNWDSWHQDQAQVASRIILNTTGAEAAAYWSDPTDNSNISSGEYPVTSTLFGFQSGALSDAVTVIGYFFTEIEGFSRFGSYTGNGSTDGPFAWCGFKPAFIITKIVSGTDNWSMQDAARSSFNVVDRRMRANSNDAEQQNAVDNHDFLSNGFKVRTTNGEYNTNGATYVFMAFAETPFKTATAR